ncbi:hypothetical protein GCM10010412_087240 [Nonomuraea recticatena]|uniref:Histidine kinase/HSP90-like ATPase domain-containing protein n=1 Tax=Nonomuraea recticatena TaxID=46178 RepID=A0ABN3T7W5_9ACTN
MAAWRLDSDRMVIELLVSELVTNALQHTAGTVRLALRFEDDLLRCEVEDTDAGTASLRPGRAREYDETGRGLYLVEQLACCWGSARTARGKAVWFELSVRPAHAAA